MKIKSRLLSFSLLSVAFAVLIGVIGFSAADFLGRQMGRNLVAMSALRNSMEADMMHDALRADVFAAVIGADRHDSTAVATALSDMKEHGDRFREAMTANQGLELDASVKDVLQKLMPQVEGYIDAANQAGAKASKGADAIQASLPAFLKTFGELEDSMARMSKKIEGFAQEIEKGAHAAVDWSKYGVAAGAALAAVVLILFSLRLTRGICRPLDRAIAVARGIAGGDLTQTIEVRGGDETAQLLAAMANMQSALKDFATAQAEMKKQHDAGTISYRIEAGRFSGSYREMAQMTNDLVSAHIAVTKKIVEVVSRYALGDLSPDMDKLPGEKAKITEAIDGVKASLKAVNAEIGKLVEAAANGDFTVRGDVEKYQHDFHKMVEGLNRLMQTSETGLNEIVRVLGALAKGDLREKITNDYQGTFGRLKDDANATVEQLTEIVTQIKRSTESINMASKEIASGNTDLSSRTEEQASSLEETASSMEELTSTVKQNAENAKQANQLAAGASEVAVKGGAVVSQVVSTMSGITESSKKIADIISVIDGIAFQTNILALNAAVEAARAGEQGRGFAVVATEVRNLAQRSAGAAKEIKELITDSVTKVESGSQLVDQAGKTMDEIVSSVKRVTDIMAEITAASQEQSSGIEQVSTAVSQMDEVTQQNAALVEEAAAAAESLEEQANVLAATVSVFKLATAEAAAERRGADRAKNVARMPAARPQPVAVRKASASPPVKARTVAKQCDISNASYL